MTTTSDLIALDVNLTVRLRHKSVIIKEIN